MRVAIMALVPFGCCGWQACALKLCYCASAEAAPRATPPCVLTTSKCSSPDTSIASRLSHAHGMRGKVMSN